MYSACSFGEHDEEQRTSKVGLDSRERRSRVKSSSLLKTKEEGREEKGEVDRFGKTKERVVMCFVSLLEGMNVSRDTNMVCLCELQV